MVAGARNGLHKRAHRTCIKCGSHLYYRTTTPLVHQPCPVDDCSGATILIGAREWVEGSDVWSVNPVMSTQVVTMYHVMQSGPSRHARSASGVYPFSVYRSLVKGVAERHCRQSNVGYMGEVSFEVVTVTTEVDDNHYRPNNLRSSNQIAGNK